MVEYLWSWIVRWGSGLHIVSWHQKLVLTLILCYTAENGGNMLATLIVGRLYAVYLPHSVTSQVPGQSSPCLKRERCYNVLPHQGSCTPHSSDCGIIIIIIKGKLKRLGGEPVSVPFCRPWILHEVTQDWTWGGSTVRSKRLATWAMAWLLCAVCCN
jgi:hypothetical protein